MLKGRGQLGLQQGRQVVSGVHAVFPSSSGPSACSKAVPPSFAFVCHVTMWHTSLEFGRTAVLAEQFLRMDGR